MGYCAYGYGQIYPRNNGIPDGALAELDDMDEFYVVRYDIVHDGNDEWFLQHEDNFHSDSAAEYLNKLAPYLESGEVDMTGDDDAHWKYVFSKGGWAEYRGHVVYDDEVRPRPNIGEDKKLEFIGGIIEAVEQFLDEKGIVIENPDKEQSENPSNIYGCDYGDMECKIGAVLKSWGVIE